jgi:hypothetical protein
MYLLGGGLSGEGLSYSGACGRVMVNLGYGMWVTLINTIDFSVTLYMLVVPHNFYYNHHRLHLNCLYIWTDRSSHSLHGTFTHFIGLPYQHHKYQLVSSSNSSNPQYLRVEVRRGQFMLRHMLHVLHAWIHMK